MFNAVQIKKLIYLLLVTCLCACSSNNKNNSAILLYNEADSLYNSEDYISSLIIIDSLAKEYKTDVDIQRKALHLSTIIKAKLAEQQLVTIDSTLAVRKAVLDSLEHSFMFIKDPKYQVDGYWIHKSQKGLTVSNATSLQARLDEDGELSLISTFSGSIKHTKLKVNGVNGSAETEAVPYDNSRNYRFTNNGISTEIVTFTNAQDSLLLKYIDNNRETRIKLTLIGTKSVSRVLDRNTIIAISDTYRLYTYRNNLKELQNSKKLAENTIRVAKGQIEKTKITDKK